MSLREVFCQDKAISILQRAYASGKMAHAYIFAGADGVGKFKTAREWAKMLLCKDRSVENQFTDSCGSCESCRLLEADSHPDFHNIYKELVEFTEDGKDKKTPVAFPIDVVREFVIDKVSNRPTLSRQRVFILSEGEKLSKESQNALLKVLEEPPEYCTIILLCTRLEKLLPTTKSRCRTVRFGPVAEDRIVEKLRQMGLSEAQSRYWSRLAQGSLGQACQWAQLELADAQVYETKQSLVVSLSGLKYAETLRLAERFLEQSKRIATVWTELDKATSKSDISRRTQKMLLQMIISALHDAMKLNLKGTEEIINSDQREQIESLARHFSPEQAAERISYCYRTLRQIESNVNAKLIFEQLLLELADSGIMSLQE